MNRRLFLRPMIALVCCAIAFATQSQEATERYIPIGESPGISGYKSIIGVVAELDYAAGRLIVRSSGQNTTVIVDNATRYYIDRSKQDRSNLLGELEDCTAGQRIEVALGEDGNAKWIKIASPG